MIKNIFQKLSQSKNMLGKSFALITVIALVFTMVAPSTFAKFWRTGSSDPYGTGMNWPSNPYSFLYGYGYGSNDWGWGYGYGYDSYGTSGNNKGYYEGTQGYTDPVIITNPATQMPDYSTIVPPWDPNNATLITMTDTVSFGSGGAQVVLPTGLQITPDGGTFDALALAAAAGSADLSQIPGASALNASIDFGVLGEKLIFNIPVQIIIPTVVPNGTVINITVKHFGETYSTYSLATIPTATCANGVATPSSTTATVSGGQIVIYTCAASSFAVFTGGGGGGGAAAAASTGGGGGGGGAKCGNKIKEASEQCDDGNKISGDGCSSLCRKEATAPIGEVAQKIITAFQDIAGHWAKSYIDQVVELGIFEGRSSVRFAPDDAITRAEFTKAILKAYKYEVPSSVSTTGFGDVAKTAWYASYISAAKDAGLIAGYSDGSFRPDSSINRAEALKIILDASKLSLESTSNKTFLDTDASAWYMSYVRYAYENTIVNGYTEDNFGPNNNITRAEAAKVIIKTLDLK